MGKFAICVLNEYGEWDNKPFRYGRITIDDFTERVALNNNSWGIEDYKRQWREGIERLKTHDTSCLVTTASDMFRRPSMWIWAMYKENDTVYIQNHILNDRTLAGLDNPVVPQVLTAENYYDFILPRFDEDDSDEKGPLEWSVPLEDVLNFKVK